VPDENCTNVAENGKLFADDEHVLVTNVAGCCAGYRVSNEKSSEPHCMSSNASSYNHRS